MFAIERKRCCLRCDQPRCRVRLDLGPEVAREFLERRLASGWQRLAPNVHYCPQCVQASYQPRLFPVA